mmetsp:Transcript_10551/g.17247  ORF Transcript_10551/g.17247 Transcript_10551/m.17247 type:complete len:119 (-) Transcript_10551:14-370(-)
MGLSCACGTSCGGPVNKEEIHDLPFAVPTTSPSEEFINDCDKQIEVNDVPHISQAAPSLKIKSYVLSPAPSHKNEPAVAPVGTVYVPSAGEVEGFLRALQDRGEPVKNANADSCQRYV